MSAIAILGGTFDPVHLGHLHMAKATWNHLSLSELRFLPCKIPVLKSAAKATEEQRLAMLRLAIDNHPHWYIDDQELQRHSASYTLTSLQATRQQIGQQTSLIFILGSDSFNQLSKWHHYQQLLNYCHLLVVPRSQTSKNPFDDDVQSLLNHHQTFNKNDLEQLPAGNIYLAPFTELTISSSKIRQYGGHHPAINDYLSQRVLNYIKEHSLYRHDKLL